MIEDDMLNTVKVENSLTVKSLFDLKMFVHESDMSHEDHSKNVIDADDVDSLTLAAVSVFQTFLLQLEM